MARTVALVAAIGSCAAAAISQGSAQEAEVGYVASVSGRVVALARGAPVLLDTLDPVPDRTRLDVLSNSELVICHYETQRLLTLRGPLRASVSADGVTVESGQAPGPSKVPCAAPVVSNHQGGLVARGIAVEDPGSRRSMFRK
ncbi:MAG TPA: hypothetical protein VGF60_07545 [Xanthobacteraceae bacterium]